ncbi:amidohydrolase [Neptuniibacter sp. 2_MG-2023]|uniref:amidohydrolase family protein n=1 Tax=Neptuniibacter sp. 2_MG-2023 TaxID=3062671 RepID=UPI0026E16AF1|nr:amidohydrolase family protein [Neptuniibacter sp. 2_MG-2023]MDO6514142.1 amidohydrolase family protein [Neptuniibacter sp. 2_MG-2023]
MSRVIDPHIHLIDLQQGDYGWLQADHRLQWPGKEKIRRSFFEADLVSSQVMELAGFVHIEAGFDNASPWRELEWLEQHCQLPFKSVAFADLTSNHFPAQLDRLAQCKSLVGIRHILDEHAETILNNERVVKHLSLIAEKGLLFEAQLSLTDRSAVKHLNQVLYSVPKLKVVINHCGSSNQLSESWMNSVTLLAHQPRCYIKCSGWEMRNVNWTSEAIEPLIRFVIRQFGLSRVMLASNFPVSELSCSYSEVWSRYLHEMSWEGFEQEMLVYENAKRIYGFD